MIRVGAGFNTDLSVSQTVRFASEAENLRYDSFWLHENSFSRDAFSYLVSASERTSSIKLGLGCASVYTRHPVVLALSFSNLNEISRGRAIMGLGTGFPMRLDLLGIKHEKPIGAIKETIEVSRMLWDGEVLNFQGNSFSLKNVKATTGKTSRIPIYVAGWKKMMLSLTGKYANGYIAKGGESPQSIRRIVAGIREAAEKSGRKISDIDISAYLLTFVSSSRDEAVMRAKQDPFVNYMLSVQDDYLYEETGISPSLKKPIAENYFKGNLSESSSHVTDEMIDSFTLSGKADEILDKVKAFEKAGINLAILQPISSKPEDVGKVLNAGSALIEEKKEKSVVAA